jgi:hypothetical protein
MRFLIVLAFLILPFLLSDLLLKPTFDALNIFWFIISLVMFIYIYLTKDKEYETNFKDTYSETMPSEKYPELLGYLMVGETKERFFIASIFELIRRNAIKIAKTNDNKDYILVKNLYYKGELSKGEFYIIKWLFHLLGNDYEVSLSKIKQDSKRNSGFFSYCYHEWSNIVEVDAAGQNIFENKGSLFNDVMVYFIISFVLAIYNWLLLSNIVIAILIGALTIVFIVYTSSFKKRTKESNLEHEKWNSFIRYVKKFDNTLHDLESDKLARLAIYLKVLKLDKEFNNIYLRSRNHDGNQLLVAIDMGVIKELDKAISKGVKYSEIATNLFFSKNNGNQSSLRKRYNENITFIYNKE